MQSLLAGRLPFRAVVMIVVDMISIGPTPDPGGLFCICVESRNLT